MKRAEQATIVIERDLFLRMQSAYAGLEAGVGCPVSFKEVMDKAHEALLSADAAANAKEDSDG